MTPTCPTCKDPMMRGVGVRWRCPVHGPDDPDVVAFVCPFDSVDVGYEAYRLAVLPPPDPDVMAMWENWPACQMLDPSVVKGRIDYLARAIERLSPSQASKP